MKGALKRLGYNAKERAYVYSGAIAGAIAPIVGARYLFFGGIESNDWVGEAIAWGGALLTNASTMVVSPHLPAPVYTGLIGTMAGQLVAEGSKRKRYERESTLENITKETQE